MITAEQVLAVEFEPPATGQVEIAVADEDGDFWKGTPSLSAAAWPITV